MPMNDTRLSLYLHIYDAKLSSEAFENKNARKLISI